MRVGILGAGQLGRMLVLAGRPLGHEFVLLDPVAPSPGGEVASQQVAEFGDRAALAALADRCEVVTFEFENVPAEALRALEVRVPVHPSARALEITQDRLLEKRLFRDLGIPTAPFLPVESEEELRDALAAIGCPAVLKTRRLGYDGKGQFVLRSLADVPPAWARLGGAPLVLEGFVPFEREISVVASRNTRGEVVVYPPIENRHRDGILRLSLAPAPGASDDLVTRSRLKATRLLEALDYVGTLAVEMFELDGHLLANEMAPRVHNSGHWTIEGAETSQFENHLRAILGLPLGSPRARGVSAMVNVIGELPPTSQVLAVPGAHLHLYGKEPRPGRKLGHVTVRADDAHELADRRGQLGAVLGVPELLADVTPHAPRT